MKRLQLIYLNLKMLDFFPNAYIAYRILLKIPIL